MSKNTEHELGYNINSMKKILIWILVLMSLGVLTVRFSSKVEEVLFGIKPKSGISVLSTPDGAAVFLDGKEVGKTPYEDKNLSVKNFLVKIEKDQAIWQGKISLVAGTVTVINRDLSKDISSFSGEILTLKRGQGITIISNPGEASIEIDGNAFGKTPQTLDIASGEHVILLTHTNYLNRSIKANLPDGFNLTVVSDLSLSEADLTTISTPVITQTPEVIVRSTPTGFLRVRDKASTGGKEVAQVKPGDSLILLEEQGNWDRVRLSDGTEGFVSASYVEKKQLSP